jgi:hypothetical protein
MTNTDKYATHILQLLELVRAQQEYIDAIPLVTISQLPAMPGFEGDWASDVVHDAEEFINLLIDTGKLVP